jgi:hypothetical protein
MDSLTPSDSFVVRVWNDTPISRRTSDSYVNATAMCRANGKRWTKYRESDRANEYLEALSTEARISVHALIESRAGGIDGGETWIHPQVAIDLARWINAPFAVWMDGWFLEQFENTQKQKAEPQPAISGANILNLLKESVDFIKELGCLEDRDHILFSDLARNNAMRVNSDFLLPPGDEEITISDAYLELFQKNLPRNQMSNVGKFVAQKYRVEFKQEPPTRIQYVDGAPRRVKSYQKNWLTSVLTLLKD